MREAKLRMLWLARSLGLFRLARRLTRDRLTILAYHGFALEDEAEFRPQLFITPERFARRLETLRRQGFRVLGLAEAVERLQAGTLPPNSVAITVDDGFHSFWRLALPRLRAAAVPATVYVTTYYVEHPEPVFRLAVQYLFWKSRRTQVSLRGLSWTPDRTLDLPDAEARQRVMWECIRHGEQLDGEAQRVRLCRELGEALGCSYDALVRSRLLHLMSPGELRAAAQQGIGIELHTHRHRFPGDDGAAARREIAENRAALERVLPGPRRHFCYPSGAWDPRQWAWLDELGVRSATTCEPGMNTADTPRHALRRFLDGENIHELEFEAALSGFDELLRALRGLRRTPSSALAPAAAPQRAGPGR